MTAIEKCRVMFGLASVLFVFTTIWGLVGENELKMLGVFIGFAAFIHSGVEYEALLRAEHAHSDEAHH